MADKYPLSDLIQYQVVHACATIPRFMSIIGYALDPDRMPSEAAGILVQAAQTLAKEAPVTSATMVLQRVKWRVNQGQVTDEQLEECSDFIDTCEDAGGVDDLEGLIIAVKPIVKHALHKAAISDAMQDFGKGRPVEKAAAEFAKIAALGSRQVGLGHEGKGVEADILAAATSALENPLPTGISELDALLRNGLEQYALGLVLGGTGDGKSLFLSSVASESIFNCIDTAIITLELSEAAWRQRVYANLLRMTPEDMKKDPKEAARRYDLLAKRPSGIGRWVVNYMTPRGTTPGDVRTWLRDLETERNFKPKLLVIDYADKLVAQVNSKRNSYEEYRDVFEGIRNICHEDHLVTWLWTASQTKGSDRKKKKSTDDTSDSQWKVRIADLVLAIERTEEDCANEQVRFRLPKRRNAAAHGEVGPIPMEGQYWRLANTNRSEPW